MRVDMPAEQEGSVLQRPRPVGQKYSGWLRELGCGVSRRGAKEAPSGNAADAANDPWGATMPRRSPGRRTEGERGWPVTTVTQMDPSLPEASGLGLPQEAVDALRPWIDVNEVGAEGLGIWLVSIRPLLPHPAGGNPSEYGMTRPAIDRLTEFARSLAECASDRARVHYQAAQYFQDNRS
jgi:hypothetical protein